MLAVCDAGEIRTDQRYFSRGQEEVLREVTVAGMIKSFTIGLIRLYQRCAPATVRGWCRFEPCCSEYMILAIESSGVLRGLYIGVGRLHRCRPPNGGIDYPDELSRKKDLDELCA